jgi:Mg2+ and Co2+ transporter CorA
LDISRNEALMANTVIMIMGCAFAFGGYITGAFGMNLDQVSYLEPKKNGFLIVTMSTVFAIIVVFVVIYIYFARLGVFPSRFSRINQ